MVVTASCSSVAQKGRAAGPTGFGAFVSMGQAGAGKCWHGIWIPLYKSGCIIFREAICKQRRLDRSVALAYVPHGRHHHVVYDCNILQQRDPAPHAAFAVAKEQCHLAAGWQFCFAGTSPATAPRAKKHPWMMACSSKKDAGAVY